MERRSSRKKTARSSKKKKKTARCGRSTMDVGGREQDMAAGRGKRRERGGGVARRSTERRRRWWRGLLGIGGGRYFNYRPPLGSTMPFDQTYTVWISQRRSLTWSFSCVRPSSMASGHARRPRQCTGRVLSTEARPGV